MTQEYIDILIADLCGRLPYGLIIKCNDGFRQSKEKLVSIDVGNGLINYDWRLTDIKPYLRPLSSMTEEEYQEFNKIRTEHTLKCLEFGDKESFELGMRFQQEELLYLYQRHYDICDLIPKGLALELPKGMYNS